MNAPARALGRWLRREGLRTLTWLFFAVVAVFTVRYALTIDWREVGRGIAATPRRVLAQAAGVAAASHALYSCFDLVGRHHTGHGLPVRRVMAVNFISYAFNLNLGSLVGAVALRVRLYTRLGLAPGVIGQVLALSVLTNWLGYFALGGAVFLLAPPPLPPDWALGAAGLRALGAGLLLVAAAYLALCLRAQRRDFRRFHLRGHLLVLPAPRMAWLQLGLSCANWSLMALLLTVLLQGRLPYATVLAVLLLAAIAGAASHVPAGLGVLEAVFVALLSHRVPVPQLLAALLAYRALYYLVPWALAAGLYPVLERRAAAAENTGSRSPSG
ncbi:lysylphosphatidylglycerol synthase domain-containing protein [Ramlibacter sp. MAHUQ-53]|uniref:lysylphosphatidylglycerol synthase domain-containing protein n=1 Tax=unclassified Ramlibacter TaxID=2617605 RepID=UPI003645782D